MVARLSGLEESAYSLVGHPFSFTSPAHLSKVLFIELKLPPSGERGVVKRGRRGRGRGGLVSYSTGKKVLEKLIPMHALPGLVLKWRRMTAALSKFVFPLLQEASFDHSCTRLHRIHASSDTHTATGRVSLKEPNLQNIPKKFDIDARDGDEEKEEEEGEKL